MHPVILLPGLLDDSSMWVEQTAGLGDVSVPRGLDLVDHDNIGECAAWILREAPEEFSLVGFSMGGYVAFELLRRAPERITRLALISTSARADTPDRRAVRQAMIDRAQSGGYDALVDELLPGVVHESRVGDEVLMGAIRDMALRVGAEAVVRQLKLIMNRPDSRAELPGIGCPTLIVCGRDDQLTPPELSKEMADGIPGAGLELVASCGHYAPMERPLEVTELLRQWLQQQ